MKEMRNYNISEEHCKNNRAKGALINKTLMPKCMRTPNVVIIALFVNLKNLISLFKYHCLLYDVFNANWLN